MAATTARSGGGTGGAVHAVATTWTASIQLVIPEGILVHPAAVDRALDVLRGRGPSHAVNGSRLFIAWGVTGDTLMDAQKEALIYARTVAELLDLGVGGMTGFRVDSNDDVAMGDDPEMVGVQESAEILGVSKQRVHQLVAGDPAFPKAVRRLAATPLWRGADVRNYAAARQDKRRRPLSIPSVN